MSESGDRLTGETSTLTASGWTLHLGASSSAAQASERADIFAVYSGDEFERPARGILAAVARGVGAGPRPTQAAHEAAHVAIHLLVEGYFGAAATLSAG